MEVERDDDVKYGRRWYLNHLAIFWLFCMIVPGAYVAHEYVNPVVFRDNPWWRTFNSYLIYYGCFMLSINWILIRYTNSSVPRGYRPPDNHDRMDPTVYCNYCNCYIPPRCHHCNLCRRCILKQDHHCFFTGTCIGHANQRFFISFTFWMGAGFIYCCFVAYWYVKSDDWRSLGWYDYVMLPLTFFRCCLGYLTFYELFCLLLFHSLGLATYAANFIFFSQMYLIVKGLTSFERKRGMKSPVHSYTINQRLRMTFGPYWALNLLMPIGLFTIQLGNGCEWESIVDNVRNTKFIE